MSPKPRQNSKGSAAKCALAALCALGLGLIPVAGCSPQKADKAAAAPSKGVVGKVLSVRGVVTYSLGAKGTRQPLKAGMELRAEWTVHTGPESKIAARLSNGHRWTLAGDLSKRISRIRALTLAPVKEGTATQLSDLGGRGGMDRSTAAGLHQERTAGTKAAPSRAPRPGSTTDLDEVAPSTDAPPPMANTRPAPRVRKSGAGKGGRPTGKTAPRKRSTLSGHINLRRRGRSRRSRSGTALPGSLRAPVTAPVTRNAERPAPAKSERESLPSRLTRGQLQKVMGPRRTHLSACLKTHKVKRALLMRLVIRGKTGRVESVRVAGRSSGDAVVRCLQKRARVLRFARFSSPTQTTHAMRLNP